MRCAVSCCRLDAPEAAQQRGALLDAPLILFQPVTEIPIAAVDDLSAECSVEGVGVGIMPVCGHAIRSVADDGTSPAEEALGHLQMARRAEQRIDQVAVPIDSPVQVAAPTVDFDVGLVNRPGTASLAPSLGPELLGEQQGKALLPLAHGLMDEHEAKLQKYLGEMPQAQLVAEAPEHDRQDDVRRVLKKVEGCSSALVEAAPTGGTPKRPKVARY